MKRRSVRGGIAVWGVGITAAWAHGCGGGGSCGGGTVNVTFTSSTTSVNADNTAFQPGHVRTAHPPAGLTVVADDCSVPAGATQRTLTVTFVGTITSGMTYPVTGEASYVETLGDGTARTWRCRGGNAMVTSAANGSLSFTLVSTLFEPDPGAMNNTALGVFQLDGTTRADGVTGL